MDIQVGARVDEGLRGGADRSFPEIKSLVTWNIKSTEKSRHRERVCMSINTSASRCSMYPNASQWDNCDGIETPLTSPG